MLTTVRICLWCFSYGHKRGTCFHRQLSKRTRWKPKDAMMKFVPAALEPLTDGTEETSRTIEETVELSALVTSNTTSPLLTTETRSHSSPTASAPTTHLLP
jgi:hypothetical protein